MSESSQHGEDWNGVRVLPERGVGTVVRYRGWISGPGGWY